MKTFRLLLPTCACVYKSSGAATERVIVHPGVWPTDLAPLFWPVVLALTLIVVALGVIQLTLALQATDDTPAPGIETIRTTPAP